MIEAQCGAGGIVKSRESRERLPPLTPEFLARFRPLDRLGGGSMGVVLRCEDRALARTVAVKLPRSVPRDTAGARFLREGRLMARVTHPNVVPVLEAGEMGELPYLVCGYVDGTTLEEARQLVYRFTARRAAAVGLDILEALAACHAQGVVHRDLKPTNVLVDANGRAFVTDFGLANLIEPEEVLTARGTAVGTLAYIAPEQLRGAAGPASDVYSCGATLYELVTGERPHVRPDSKSLVQAILRSSIKPVRERAGDAPRWLALAIESMLVRDPHARPSAAEAVAFFKSGLFGAPRKTRVRTPAPDAGPVAALAACYQSPVPRRVEVPVVPLAPGPHDSHRSERIHWTGWAGACLGALVAIAVLVLAPSRPALASALPAMRRGACASERPLGTSGAL